MNRYQPEDATYEDIYDFDEFVVKSKAPVRPKGTYTLDDKGEPLRPLNRPRIDETNVRLPPILVGHQKGNVTLPPPPRTSQVPSLAPIKGIHGPSYDTKGKLAEQARAQQYVYVTEKRAHSLDMKAKTEKGTGLQMPVPVRSYQKTLTASPDTMSSTDIRVQIPGHKHTAIHDACRNGRNARAPTPIFRDTVTSATNKAHLVIAAAIGAHKDGAALNSKGLLYAAAVNQSYTDNREHAAGVTAAKSSKTTSAVNHKDTFNIEDYEKEFQELMKAPFDPSKDPRILAYEERINSRPPRYTSTVKLDLTDKTACRTLASELSKNETFDVECMFQPAPPVAPRPPSGAPQTGYRRRQFKPANKTISVNDLPKASPQNENEAGTGSKTNELPKNVRKQMKRYFNR